MSEKTVRHLIAFFGTLIALLVWFSGYVSGVRGWWATVFSLIFVYIAIYTLVEA